MAKSDSTKNVETSSNQVSLDDVLDLEWVHAADLTYHHDAYCEHEPRKVSDRYIEGVREITSQCRSCGRTIHSRLASFRLA